VNEEAIARDWAAAPREKKKYMYTTEHLLLFG
jgi:hypothetical protein